jgi:hypothetical protein
MWERTATRRPKFLVSAAWLLHALAWFLPVHELGVRPPTGVRLPAGPPGWQAFQVAFSVFDPGNFISWYGVVVGGLSAAGTVLFIFGSPWVALRGSHRLRWAGTWAASMGFVVNSLWYVLAGSDRTALRIGYFLWCSSFGVLAVGLFDLARQEKAP